MDDIVNLFDGEVLVCFCSFVRLGRADVFVNLFAFKFSNRPELHVFVNSLWGLVLFLCTCYILHSQMNFQKPTEALQEPEKNLLQLGKGGSMTLPGGRSPPGDPSGGAEPPQDSPFFLCFFVFFLNLAMFSTPHRKLLLPPSDRARRCDSESPIESSGARI